VGIFEAAFHGGIKSWPRKQNKDEQIYLDSADLEALTARVKTIFDIRDRKYGLPAKTYPKCFIGSEAVAQLIVEGIAAAEADAVRIGNRLCGIEPQIYPTYLL
jgi:hypothetical protein